MSHRYDALQEVEDRIDSANNDYIFYTISSVSNANAFCNTYNHSNNYNGLKLGQRIQINDGVYNRVWIVAGFDCEYNHTASDGTIKNNGYGICLIPEIPLFNDTWNDNGLSIIGYANSTIHTSTLHTVANNLKNVLGSHLINRNVLLSDKVSTSTGKSTSYTWTTAYCTLMSGCQLTGEISKYSNKYDDGEANYKLPLFNYKDTEKYKPSDYITIGYYTSWWLRGIDNIDNYDYLCPFCVRAETGEIDALWRAGGNSGIRPLVYIR